MLTTIFTLRVTIESASRLLGNWRNALFLIVFSLAQTSFAENFIHFSVANGLSQNTAQTISQGNDGLLYIGTQEGLNVFDGYQFKVFKHNPSDPYSLADSSILSTYVDSQGTLWVATKLALHRFDSRLKKFQRFLLNTPPHKGNSLNKVTGITESRDGTLWLLISNYSGLGRLNKDSADKIDYVPDESLTPEVFNNFYDETLHISSDNEGRLWLGTRNGLALFTPETQQFKHINYDSNAPPNSRSVNHIHHDKNGDAWLSTNNGLYQLDSTLQLRQHFQAKKSLTGEQFEPTTTKNQSTHLSSNKVTATLRTSDNQLWVATLHGLNRYSATTGHFQHTYRNPAVPSSLGSNEIIHLFEDRSGELWISTGQTLDKYSRHSAFQYIGSTGNRNSIYGDIVWAIHKTKDEPGILWLGTKDGLYKYSLTTQSLLKRYKHESTSRNSLPNSQIRTITDTGDGQLWLGTGDAGVVRFNINTEKIEHFPHDANNISTPHRAITGIAQDTAGRLWFASKQGLSLYNKENGSFVRYNASQGFADLEKLHINTIDVSVDGSVWLGSVRGLFNLNVDKQTLTHHPYDPSNLGNRPYNDILSLHKTPSKDLWIGSSQGLYQLEKANKTFKKIDTDKHFQLGSVLSIEHDNSGNLWLGTNAGLIRYSPKQKKFNRFHAAQGLQVLEYGISSSFADQESLYMGGVGGLVYFHPEKISLAIQKSQRYKPRVILREILVANKQILPATQKTDQQAYINSLGELQLTHHDLLVSFKFTSDHYASPLENQFAYQLKGYDPHWITTVRGEHSATYTHLPAGRYTLLFKAANPEGIWGKIGSQEIIVKPPPWLSWWAWLGYLTGVIIILATLWQQQRRKIQAERWAYASVEVSERRYRNFVENSTEGIWRLDLDPPIPVALPANDQIELICERAMLVEANEALAKIYHVSPEHLFQEDTILLKHANIKRDLEAWIKSDYRTSNQVSTYYTEAHQYWVSSAYTGEVHNEKLHRIWGVSQDVSAQHSHMQSLQHMASHDPLTSIKNRAGFYEEAKAMIAAMGKNHDQLALILLDLNDFKEINDTLGHDCGDKLLQELGRRFQQSFPDNLYARFGGDEFVFLIAYREDITPVNELSNKILKVIQTPQLIENINLVISASLGIALSRDCGSSLSKLLRFADMAMYKAKNRKLPICFATPDDESNIHDKLALMGQFDKALRENQLVLYYQPRLDLKTNKANGCEALVRWQHPKLGLLGPDRFIPAVERTTLIHDLTYWVINEALSQWRTLSDNLGTPIDIAINLSVYNLYSTDFFPMLKLLLDKHSVAFEHIELEVTESVMMDEREEIMETLNKIRELGIKVAIDDFGTGYSSLSCLQQLPVDILKIDKQFSLNFIRDPRNKAMLEWIINLAHIYNFCVVAEGIEEKEVLDFLSAKNCDFAQGYYIARPMPVREFLEFIQTSSDLACNTFLTGDV